MKRAAMTVIAALLVAFAGNEPDRLMPRKTEINLIQPAVIIGIDATGDAQEPAEVTLLLSELAEASGDQQGGGGSFQIMSAKGQTVAASADEIAKTSFKEIPASCLEYYLIGEDAVKSSLPFYMDYLSKDNELRLTSKLYFLDGDSAKSAIDIVSKEKSTDIFQIFGVNSGVAGRSSSMAFIEYLKLNCEGIAFAVPTVRITNLDGEDRILPEGYAIVEAGQYRRTIRGAQARGYNLITNRPTHSLIDIDAGGGRRASVVLEQANTAIRFRFEGERLAEVVLRTHFTTDALDAGALGDLRTSALRRETERKQTDIVQDELTRTVALAKEMNCDFLGIGQQLRLRHPYAWARLEENWAETLAEVPVRIEVSSRLQRTFDVVKLDS